MNKHEIDSIYKQFYIADVGVEQDAPDDWTDEDIEKRYNSREFIVALVTSGEISARIICFAPNETNNIKTVPDFKISTCVKIQTGKVGVYEWPWEKLEEHIVEPGLYNVQFNGYDLSLAENEEDYYTVEISKAL